MLSATTTNMMNSSNGAVRRARKLEHHWIQYMFVKGAYLVTMTFYDVVPPYSHEGNYQYFYWPSPGLLHASSCIVVREVLSCDLYDFASDLVILRLAQTSDPQLDWKGATPAQVRLAGGGDLVQATQFGGDGSSM